MSYPGDQTSQIEAYLAAKGETSPRASQDAYRAALKIAALLPASLTDWLKQETKEIK